MFTNYFKIALRGFSKYKLTFFINLFGLSLGLGVAIIIGLWIQDEMAMDKVYPDSDRIFQVMEHQAYQDDIFTTVSTPGILARELKAIYDDIEYAACHSWYMNNLLTVNGEGLKLPGIYAEPDLLNIFQFQVIHGKKTDLLEGKAGMVITENGAQKIFGRSDVVGESITINQKDTYIVDAVIKDPGSNSSYTFEYILPFQVFFDNNSWLSEWGNNGPSTLVKLSQGADYLVLSDQIKGFIKTKNERSVVDLFLFPFSDLYLYGEFKNGKQVGGKIESVKLFGLIGIFVLLIACINFMNLATAKSQKRAKEVGVRKVVGADKGNLVKQFMLESILTTFMSGGLAILLVELCMPFFSTIMLKTLSIPYHDFHFWLKLGGIILVTGFIAGSYPALYLSGISVSGVFKSFYKSDSKAVWARKGLVVFQFSLATVLIISTIVVYHQIGYALKKDAGYEKDQLATFVLEGNLVRNFENFKTEISKHPGVLSVSRAGHQLLGRNNNTGMVNWEGKNQEMTILFETIQVDYDFIETTGMRLKQGRSFSRDFGADSVQGAIVNQTAYELITKENPDNNQFRIGNREYEIAGVVENFHFQNIRSKVEPALFFINSRTPHIGFVRFDPKNTQSAMEHIASVAKELNPEFPFKYTFMDENYAKMYGQELRLRELSKYFSILTIIISCLGLFGLSAHVAQQKTKEIGIRKVLGASTLSILNLINKEFAAIVGVSILLGSGLAWYFMNDWLSGFEFKAGFEWWIIPTAGLLLVAIAILTVSSQAYRASNIKPATTLKEE
jgi:putative ABC transport system permease protein